MPDVRTAVRPLLKWAGGKRQLLPELRPFYPRRFERYFEPFLGSGAVFLDLHNAGLLDGRGVRLSDINADIVGCYRMVRDNPSAVIQHLRGHERAYRVGRGRALLRGPGPDVQPGTPPDPGRGRPGVGTRRRWRR